jgi:hypothetical protein
MERNDLRELFLLFAIKRKIKLMSFLVNSEEFKMEVDENNFIDIIENSAYDIGVLVYREYFLLLNTKTDKTVNLLIKAFVKGNSVKMMRILTMKKIILNRIVQMTNEL